MKASAFALLLVVTVAYAGDAPEQKPAEPEMKIFRIPVEEPEIQLFTVPPTQPRATTHPRYWICPKDETMLRVVAPNHKGEFECPIDGTKMKPAVGRSSAIFLLQEKPAN